MREGTPRLITEEDILKERRDTVVVANRGEATVQVLQKFKERQKENYPTLPFHHGEIEGRPEVEGHPEEVRHNALGLAKILMRIDPSLVTKETLADIADSTGSHDSVLNATYGERLTRFRGFYNFELKDEKKKQLREVMEKAGILKGNERLSAEWLDQELRRYVDEKGEPIFDGPSRDRMRCAIAATFPECDPKARIPDAEYEKYFREGALATEDLEKYRTGIKIWQPYLDADSSMVAFAVAQADLRGAVGSPEPEVFKKSGDAEFRESVLWVGDALKNGTDAIAPEEREKIAAAIRGWLQSQVTFAMWQKVLFWKAVEENKLINGSAKREEIHKALAERYNANFDRNILAAKERAEKADQLEFEDLVEEIGYEPNASQ